MVPTIETDRSSNSPGAKALSSVEMRSSQDLPISDGSFLVAD